MEPAHTNMTDDTTGGHQKHQVSEEARLPLPDPRTKLYAGGFSSLGARGASAGRRLRVVVRAWLEELRRVGLSGKEKTAGEVDYPPGYRDGSSVRSVQLENGETVWLRFGAYPEKHGFLQTEVLETPPRTDRAILAILSVLEGGEADLSNIRDALTPRWDSEREERVYGRLDYAEERLIECADELLLHYRTDLRELPQAEQRVLRRVMCNESRPTDRPGDAQVGRGSR